MERRNIFLGNAIFTITSKATGERFTYKIIKPKQKSQYDGWYVYILTGNNNTKDYTYIGSISMQSLTIWGIEKKEYIYYHSKDSKISTNAISVIAFDYFLKHIDHKFIDFEHAGRCFKCGRLLTTPESIKSGIGPVCASFK